MEGEGLELKVEDYDLKIKRMEGEGVVIRGEEEKGEGRDRDRGRSMMMYEGMTVETEHNTRNMNKAEQSGVDCRHILEVRCRHLSSHATHENALCTCRAGAGHGCPSMDRRGV
jgi:hypothetical protein